LGIDVSSEELKAQEEGVEPAPDTSPTEDPNAPEKEALQSSDSDDDSPGAQSRPKNSRASNIFSGFGSSKKRRLAIVGLGGGSLIGAFIAGAAIFSVFGTFRLDHILQNIDVKTFSRFNASLDGRSKAYIKSYIRVRMLEFDGASKDKLGDAEGNLYFRTNKTSTQDSYFQNWYRSMRASTFETDVLNKNGIFFTSAVGPDGRIRAAKITIKDDPIDLNKDPKIDATMQNIQNDLIAGDKVNLDKLSLHINQLGPDMDQFLEREIFDSPQEGRKAVKKVVNDNTHFYQFFKRRHLRKDIQSMIGLRSWRFFETTQEKYLAKKQNIQQKIVSKIFPGQGELSSFLNCIFVGSCNTNTDSVNPDNTVTSLDDAGVPIDSQDTGAKDSKGNPVSQNLEGDKLASSIDNELKEVVEEDLSKVANDTTSKESGTITSRIIKSIVSSYVSENAASSIPENPQAWWNFFQKLAKFNDMVKSSKLSKMVQKARLAQFMALYAMYAIARDQGKTGQDTTKEYADLVKTTDSFNVSEGWQQHVASSQVATNGLVFAAALTPDPPNPNISKQDYCKSTHVKQKGDYAWFCDDQKPNSGGAVGGLEAAYNSSVGYIIGPIASVVDGINSTPLGVAINFLSNFTGKIVSVVSDATISPIMDALGITDGITGLATTAMEKFLQFAGVVPLFTGVEPGIANFLFAGSAGTAEGATRQAGGVASTALTLNYSNQLAAQFEKDNIASTSVFDRYASLDNPTSLFSTLVYNVGSTSISSQFQGLINGLSNLPVLFGNLISGRTLAASTDQSASAGAQWAGVNTYDMPAQCMQLDPLDPNYVNDATNAWSLGITPNMDTLRDSSKFWAAVYEKVGADNEDAAGKIFNCALLDRQVQGSLGGMYNYTDDGGLQPST